MLMGVYRESWFTQFLLPSVVKTLKIYLKREEKYCLSFQNTFQRFTVKIPKFYR
jgi:hypothetical protein